MQQRIVNYMKIYHEIFAMLQRLNKNILTIYETLIQHTPGAWGKNA